MPKTSTRRTTPVQDLDAARPDHDPGAHAVQPEVRGDGQQAPSTAQESPAHPNRHYDEFDALFSEMDDDLVPGDGAEPPPPRTDESFCKMWVPPPPSEAMDLYDGDDNADPRRNHYYQVARSHIAHGLPVIPAYDGKSPPRGTRRDCYDYRDPDEEAPQREPRFTSWRDRVKTPSFRSNTHGTLNVSKARRWFCGERRWREPERPRELLRLRSGKYVTLIDTEEEVRREEERLRRERQATEQPLRDAGWTDAQIHRALDSYRSPSTSEPCGVVIPPYVAVIDIDEFGWEDDEWYRALPPTLRGKSLSGKPHLYFRTRRRIAYCCQLDRAPGARLRGQILGEGHYVLEETPLVGDQMEYLPQEIEERVLRPEQSPITMEEWLELGDTRKPNKQPPSVRKGTGGPWRGVEEDSVGPGTARATGASQRDGTWEKRLLDELRRPPQDGDTWHTMNKLTLPTLSLWGEEEGLRRLEGWVCSGSTPRQRERLDAVRSLFASTVAKCRAGRLSLPRRTLTAQPLGDEQKGRLVELLAEHGLARRRDTRQAYVAIASALLEVFVGDVDGLHFRNQAEMVERTGLKQHTVSSHMSKLTEGRLTCKLPLFVLDALGRKGTCNSYRLTDLGRWVLVGGLTPGDPTGTNEHEEPTA